MVTLDADVATPPEGLGERVEVRGDRVLAITYDRSRTHAGALLARLSGAGLTVVDVSTQEADLEDVFLKLTRRAA